MYGASLHLTTLRCRHCALVHYHYQSSKLFLYTLYDAVSREVESQMALKYSTCKSMQTYCTELRACGLLSSA